MQLFPFLIQTGQTSGAQAQGQYGLRVALQLLSQPPLTWQSLNEV